MAFHSSKRWELTIKNSVIGYDISKSRVGQVRHELVLAGKTNIVTTEIGDIQSANIYVITVPTPTDKNNKPDISCLIEACKTVASVINKGDLIIIESTVYPSMTERCVYSYYRIIFRT